jgi:hypothetical protein
MQRQSQLIASSAANLSWSGNSAAIVVRFTEGFHMDALLKGLRVEGSHSGRGLQLRFEQIRGEDGLPVIDIYLNTDPDHQPGKRNYVGAMALYGLGDSTAGEAGGPEGKGQYRLFEAAPVFARVRHQSNWSARQFSITLMPQDELPAGTTLTIGRVALYYYEEGE